MAENQNEIPMEQEKEERRYMVTLTDEAGSDEAFEFLDLFSYEGTEYVVLLPPDGDDSVVILEIECHEDGSEAYVGVRDEKLLDKVFRVFKERNQNRFDFED